jgi:type II secretory pathway pseudopilin PulG
MRQKSSALIQRALFRTNYGFSLVEAILASAVFGLLLAGLAGSLVYGQESTVIAGSRARALMLTEEGLEAVRNVRDSGFSNLTDGTYGLDIAGGTLVLSNTPDSSSGFFREITVSTIDQSTKNVSVKVTWKQNEQRNGEVMVSSILTNWTRASVVETCNSYAVSQGYTSGVCRPSANACGRRNTHLPEGDTYCTGGANSDTCCAVP